MRKPSLPSRRDFVGTMALLGSAYAASYWMSPLALAQVPSGHRIADKPVADKGFASIRQIGDGVYATISDRSKGLQTRSNGGFIIGKDTALLVEGFQTPIGAAFQVETYRTVSKVPIRAALNTHFHFDHSMGNSFYGGQSIPIWAHALLPRG